MASKEENEWEANRKVFIGGLKVDTVEEELHSVFAEFGAIYDHVVIRDPETRRSRGFGFVTFEKPDSVQLTLDARPIQVNGKEVDVKRAVPRSQSVSTPQEAKTQKLFVGGLLTSTNEEHIREAFSSYGKITSVDIMRDKDGCARGFAFVVFDEFESVDRIVQKRYISVNGKEAECKRAEPFGSIASSKSRRPREEYGTYDRRGQGRGRGGRGRDEGFHEMGRYSGGGVSGSGSGSGSGGQFSGSGGYGYHQGSGYGAFDQQHGGTSDRGYEAGDNYGFGGRGYGGSNYGGSNYGGSNYGNQSYGSRGYREGGGDTYSGHRQNPMSGSYSGSNYQDYYSQGYGRSGGYEAAAAPTAQYSLGKYEPEQSSFGPTRGYSGSGVGGLLGRPSYNPYGH